ncbi:uncharacterized protein LOC116588140 [Mustela erminea]|uniref:uncharacterized protein LOC116588140 n=1 Tax=Mustela erminea TaxID=36723 RepID=UPI0013872812|nr:uncharacterized protein LOC116588140 [Mustela erminea]
MGQRTCSQPASHPGVLGPAERTSGAPCGLECKALANVERLDPGHRPICLSAWKERISLLRETGYPLSRSFAYFWLVGLTSSSKPPESSSLYHSSCLPLLRLKTCGLHRAEAPWWSFSKMNDLSSSHQRAERGHTVGPRKQTWPQTVSGEVWLHAPRPRLTPKSTGSCSHTRGLASSRPQAPAEDCFLMMQVLSALSSVMNKWLLSTRS